MGPFLMADDMNQLEILSCEQQFVKIIHIYLTALFLLQCLNKSGDDSSLLLDSEEQI